LTVSKIFDFNPEPETGGAKLFRDYQPETGPAKGNSI
jgi:hypothetical protein